MKWKTLTFEERLETTRIHNSWNQKAIKIFEMPMEPMDAILGALKLEMRHSQKQSTEHQLAKACLEKLK